MSRAPEDRPVRPLRSTRRTISGALAALALSLAPALLTAVPAQAATASVVLTPSSATAESGALTTYTLSVTCNGPGTCDGLTASFPANAVTGNGSRTDLSSWIGNSSCSGVTRTVAGGFVTFTYPTFATGTQNCTFGVRAPNFLTLNGAQATLTPTLGGPGIPSATGTPATLTLTAGHNVSMGASGTARVLPGGTVTYTAAFNCGGADFAGDIGLSALHIEVALAPDFVFTGMAPRPTWPGTFTLPAVGSSGGTIIYDDPTGTTCGNPPLTSSNTAALSITGTITGGTGTQACMTTSSTFTYLDRTTADSASATTSPCPTVVDLQTQVTKNGSTRSLGNAGQYTFGGNTFPYTFPGDWDQSGASVFYDIRVSTVPTSIASGLSYRINDPLPCLDNVVSNVYTSNATGVTCVNPAFIPKRVTVTGFAPTAADAIVLHLADGSTTTVPFASGGWTMPTTGSAVSEIEIPAFTGEGSNTVGAITFRVVGYAAPTAQPNRLMRNLLTSQPYLSGTTDTIGTPQTSTANVLIVDQGATVGDTGRPIFQPALVSTLTGTCTASVALRNNTGRTTNLEITQTPSAAIYLDYLAPAGATVTSTTSINFAISGITNGKSYTSGLVAASSTPNYNGTGRTLYRWTVPTGTVAVPGVYTVGAWNLALDLGAGCAGTYQNDMTLGYGAPLTRCISGATAPAAPLYPAANADLRANGSPLTDNYCGASAPLSIDAQNPGFTVDKTVQGSLDAAAAAPGVTGKVGASGGEATYTVSFVNSGESNLDDPVLYDLLPRVGDTEATTLTSRDSQFAVTLLSVGALPADVTVEYSTAVNPCRPEVLPSNPGCVADWSATAPTPLSSATALRFAYSGTLGVTGAPVNGFTVSYDVTTPAITVGRIAWNSVGANATAGGDLVGAAESTYVGLEADGQPAIVKAAAAPTYDTVGQTVSFTFTVTNEASVPVTGVTVTDSFTDAAAGSSPGAVTCVSLSTPAGTCSGASTDLAAGQSALFVMSYTVRQADLDHGVISDQATVTASPSRGPALSNTSDVVTVTAVQSPDLTLLKSVSPTTADAAGDTVAYSFLVTNTGNVTLSSLGITETAFGGSGATPAASCPVSTLAPTASTTCTASYALTQDDIDAGTVVNTAVAAAEFDGAGVLSPSSTATVTVDQNPSLALLKTANLASVGSAGQSLTFSFQVTNDGNVTIDAITVTETAFSGTGTLGAITCPATVLGPGDDLTCTAAYTVTQDDIDSGAIDNSASVTGDDPAGDPIPAPPTSAITVPVVFAPALTVTKTANVTHVTRPGTVIRYSFDVVNNGNTTLTGLTIDETAFTGAGALTAVTCPVTTLAPTDQTTCTAEYTVLAADSGRSAISNTAEASAAYSSGGATITVTSAASTALVAVDPAVGLALTGSDGWRWGFAFAALALGAGAALLFLTRRRRDA
ncbi:MAG TPA: hypothetical protein VL294_14470 [Pseudolysinimonas sp.]|jgi:hypothetical protein|nr:hypothetical protein [Pseudolysinimonas sp.]